jgi:hypothetical protein
MTKKPRLTKAAKLALELDKVQTKLQSAELKLSNSYSEISELQLKLDNQEKELTAQRRRLDEHQDCIKEVHALLDAFNIPRAYEIIQDLGFDYPHSTHREPYSLAARWMLYVKQEAERVAAEGAYIKVEQAS